MHYTLKKTTTTTTTTKLKKDNWLEGRKAKLIAQRKQNYLSIPCPPAPPCPAKSYKKIQNNFVTLTQTNARQCDLAIKSLMLQTEECVAEVNEGVALRQWYSKWEVLLHGWS